jgi:hypothetical protein
MARTDSTSSAPVVYQTIADIGALQARVDLLEQRVADLAVAPAKPKGVLPSIEGQIGFKTFLLAVLLFTAMIFSSCAAYKVGGENLVRLAIELSRDRSASGKDGG